jgi:hypothetical protein
MWTLITPGVTPVVHPSLARFIGISFRKVSFFLDKKVFTERRPALGRSLLPPKPRNRSSSSAFFGGI